jgi:hypothetical protein
MVADNQCNHHGGKQMNESRLQTAESANTTDAVQVITDALRGLRFGTVKLIVQDGVLIRVERTENRQVARRLASS